MAKTGFKFIGMHKAGCLSVREVQAGRWESVWANPERETTYLDALGRRGSTRHMWLTFRCNDPNCECRLLVRTDVLTRGFPNYPEYNPTRRK
jgi:hypothetical protein